MEWLTALVNWFQNDASGLANFIQIAGGAIAGGSFAVSLMRRRQRRQETYEQSLEQALATRKEQLSELQNNLASERQFNPYTWVRLAAKERRDGNEDLALKALSDGIQATSAPLQATFAELAKDEISRYPNDQSDRRVKEAFRLAMIASLVKPETREVDDLLREIKAVRAMSSVRAGAPTNDTSPEHSSLQSSMSQSQARAAVVQLLDALYVNAQEGRFLVAERLGFRAREIASRSLPQLDRLVLRAQFGWAQSLELCGLLQPALVQFDDLVASQRTALGDTDDDTLASKQIRARVLCHLSRHKEALKEIGEVVEVKNTRLSDEHPDMLITRLLYVEILDRAGQKQEALARIDPLLGLARKVWGARDRRTFSAWHRNARLLGETHAFDRALKMVEELIAEEEATLGSEHHVTLEGRALRASILFKWAPSRMELSDVNSVLESLRQMHGPEHHETLDFRHMRAQALIARGEVEAAYAEAKTLPASFDRVYGPNNPDTLAIRHLILRLGYLLNEPEVANPHVAEQMLASMIAALGSDHTVTIATEKLRMDILRAAGLDASVPTSPRGPTADGGTE